MVKRCFVLPVVGGDFPGLREISLTGHAGQTEEFVEAGGYDSAVGAAAVVIEEDDGGVVLALIGGGDPIPGAAAGGGEAKAGAEIFFVGQLVEGFEVQGLETIDLPTLGPPARAARLFELEAGSLDGGVVLVQLQESFRKKFTQFLFDCLGLRVQQAAKIGLIDRFELIGRWTRAKSCNGAADARGDDEKEGGKCQWAKDKNEKLIHALMILHCSAAASTLGSDRNLRSPGAPTRSG